MRRYFIVVGDKTTGGGTVIEGEQSVTIHGQAQSYHGARIYCPACNSEGRIVGAGPTRPHTMHGKQAALENDLCICKCESPPRLIASQDHAWMSFESDELARMGYAPDGRQLSEQSQTRPRYIEFRLNDVGTLEGLDCVAHFDDGSTASGTFDHRNQVRFENPTGSACKRLTLSPLTGSQRSTFCSGLLATLTA